MIIDHRSLISPIPVCGPHHVCFRVEDHSKGVSTSTAAVLEDLSRIALVEPPLSAVQSCRRLSIPIRDYLGTKDAHPSGVWECVVD